MNISEWLHSTETRLKLADIGTARLDCLVLLEDITGKDRSYLLAHPETQLMPDQVQTLDQQIKRRCNHEPLAYIRGFTEFYGQKFMVNKHVLEPRPESETMIDLLMKIMNEEGRMKKGELTVIDVGTGSGTLAITAKLKFPEAEIIATDIDKNCLKIARQNAKNHGTKIKFIQGDLLQPLPILHSSFSILLCNLPYVPDNHTVNDAAMMEPKVAIFGGRDGLDLYIKMFKQLQELKLSPTYIVTESLPFQHKALTRIAQESGYKLDQTDDFIQVFGQE